MPDVLSFLFSAHICGALLCYGGCVSHPAARRIDSAADKAAAAAGRAKQYPGAHCSAAYAT